MRYISNNTSTTATLIDTYMTNRWRDIDKHIHTHSLTHTHIQNVQSKKSYTSSYNFENISIVFG